MSDEEHHRQVDFLLDSLWRTQPDLEQKHDAFMEAAQAFCEEAERDRNSRRLPNLRRAVDKAAKAASGVFNQQAKNLDELGAALDAWKSPGRAYVRFRDEAAALGYFYHDVIEHEIVPWVERTMEVLESYDAAAR
jgi:hypothetical protein